MTPGGPESIRHNRKGWKYFNEPDIIELIEKGYDVQYVLGFVREEYLRMHSTKFDFGHSRSITDSVS